MEIRQLESKHIEKFLNLLDEHRQYFFETEPALRPQRLYFVDSDVLSVYIDGRVRDDTTSQWASLFSLTEQSHDRTQNSEETNALHQAIGQAVSRFLFGQFNLQLSSQKNHYYLTAEHERELKSIISAVLHHAIDPVGNWQTTLQTEYLKFCGDVLAPDAAQAAAENITYTLVEQSPLGLVPRAYAVDRDFTSSFSSNLIRPPAGDGSSFIFSEENDYYTETFEKIKSGFFGIFLKTLSRNHAGAEKYFPLKSLVFKMHRPDLPVRRYVEAVWLSNNLQSLGSKEDLEFQTLIAARQANDVISLARLSAFSAYLNNKHPLLGERQWEICLISGSSMLRELIAALGQSDWSDLVQNRVRLLHPLCFLRHPELYDPDGVKALEDRGEGEFQDEEYALTQIFRRKKSHRSSIDSANVTDFIQSLTRTLHGVVTREAKRNDRSLRSFWNKLELDDSYNQNALTANVRSYIAYRFTDTLFKLTELVPGEKHTLSHVSIPTLDLRHSPSALKLLKSIRDSVSISKPGISGSTAFAKFSKSTKPNIHEPAFSNGEFQKVLQEDLTGYSAMLCASMGFIVRGEDWLNLAQVMASTAVMFALGSKDSTSDPQGNEALYLRAFLSRIMFDPRKSRHEKGVEDSSEAQIKRWLENQLKSMEMARAALDNWRQSDKAEADELVPETKETRYDLMLFRYAIEEIASHSFAIQWRLLLNEGLTQTYENDLIIFLEDGCKYLTDKFSAYEVLNSSPREKDLLESHYQQTVDFLGSQLWAVILQCWLLLRFAKTNSGVVLNSELASDIENRLLKVEKIISEKLPVYRELMQSRTGQVVRLSMETFAIAKLGLKKGNWGLSENCFNEVRFAAIDDLRFTFFRDAWNQASSYQA